MSEEYTPPGSTSFPFNFSEQGYSSPNATSLLLNFKLERTFGTLRAAVNVMTPYWYTTHTYAKSCPKYVVGYGSGGIQIIRGRCLYGGIRDLQGIITGLPALYTVGNLPAYVNSTLNTSQVDLSSYCYSITPKDLSAYSGSHLPSNIAGAVTGIKKKSFGDLPAFVNMHFPGNIHAYLGVHQPISLPSSINVLKNKGINNLGSLIDTHPSANLLSIIGAHSAAILRSNIWAYNSIYKDLTASTYSWQEYDLSAVIGSHDWNNLGAIVGSFGKDVKDLNSYIFVEKYKGINNLISQIGMHQASNLRLSITGTKTGIIDLNSIIHSWDITNISAIIASHSPERLRANIRSWYSSNRNLRGAIRSWYRGNFSYISSNIDLHQPENLQSFIDLHQPINFPATIGTHIAGHLYIILRTWHLRNQQDLFSNIMGWQQGNITAYLGGVPPGNLRVYLRAWQRSVSVDFPSYIHSWEESPNLTAMIASHQYENIHSIIRGWQRGNQKNLIGILHSWQVDNLTAYIFAHPYKTFKASIRGWQHNIYKNLTGGIKGWQTKNLNAIVDTHIWKLLAATIFPHPPPPLPATIRGWARNLQKNMPANIYGWGASNLGAIAGGHPYGNLGIILKSVHLAMTENLTATMHGWQQSDLGIITKGGHLPFNLGMLLKGVAVGVTKDLYSIIHGWQLSDLSVITKGGHLPQNITAYINIFQSTYKNLRASSHGWIETFLPAIVEGHLPLNISAAIRSWYANKFSSLAASTYGWGEFYLNAMVGSHIPGTLRGMIKVYDKIYKSLPAYIRGWQQSDLGMLLDGTHPPVDLSAKLSVEQRRERFLSSTLYAWHARDLLSSITVMFPYDLCSTIYPILPSDLSGYLKARLRASLPTFIRGWQDSNLSANIQQIWTMTLSGFIYGRTDTKKNLPSRIKGYGVEYRDLNVSITAFHWQPLTAILRATYLANIHAYIYAVAPKNLSGKVQVWHERFLQGILNGQNYPWNLMAQIYSSGDWSTFTASIQPRQNVAVYADLTMTVHPWERREFPAYILGSGAPILSAYINPLGYAHDLHGSIRPKMIRLTTIINIPTQPHKDLSATINYPCFRTGYSILPAYIYTKYKSDLYAYIKPICFNYRPVSLPAKIGYSDSYLEIDKFKLSINIYPNEFFTEDKFKLLLNLLDAESLLTAYIRGTLRYNGISARIIGDAIPSYVFDIAFKNRETVIHKTYDGIFKEFETVEMLFKSAVKDYFFSSDGGFAWKSNRFDKWVFDVRSILPANTTLGTMRRLHKATEVYDLKKFESVDEAIRAAIAYVTEYPQSILRASIINLGTYKTLSSVIIPRYTVKSRNSLESTITPIGDNIVINEKETITKI